jgi:hypothetical protein
MAGVGPLGWEVMSDHPIAEATVGLYVSLLLALGQIGLGWFLAFRSQDMVHSFSSGTKSEVALSRFLVIWGWALLIGGCLCIALFLFLLVVIAIQSL